MQLTLFGVLRSSVTLLFLLNSTWNINNYTLKTKKQRMVSPIIKTELKQEAVPEDLPETLTLFEVYRKCTEAHPKLRISIHDVI
jgi:hypothetical protein